MTVDFKKFGISSKSITTKHNKMLKEKIKAGQLIYGTGYTALTHAWASSLKKADLDFAFIDTEHTSMNRAEMASTCELLKAIEIVVRPSAPAKSYRD